MGPLNVSRRPTGLPVYREDLDGLRAVAVVLVMLSHAGGPWSNGGNAGVTAFFVLSGYLITRILNAEFARTGRVDLIAFYRRRIRRLAPALMVLLAVTILVGLVVGGSSERLLGIVGSFLYINNWLAVLGVPIEPFAHTWTLAIEEQFYLLWPLALVVLKPRRALAVALALAAGSALARVVSNGSLEYFSTLTRGDAILVGSALALGSRAVLPPAAALLGVLGLIVISLTDMSHDLAISLSIVAASAIVLSPLPSLGRLAPIGRRAYSLYLWNWPLTLILGAGGFFVTIVVAELSYRVAERPFMRAHPESAAMPSVRHGLLAASKGRHRPAFLVTAVVLATLVAGSCSASTTVTPVPSPTPPPCPRASSDQATCILVLGDSIAAGDGVAGPDRWPARLEALLRVEFPDANVVVSNWAQGASQIDLLETRVAELPLESYEVAIVITGVNDTAVRSVEEWAPRYVAAIDKLEKAGVTVVIGTAPPTFEGGVFTDRLAPVAQALRAIAGTRPMLDIAQEWHDLGVDTAGGYYADLIHPNEQGQAVIAESARAVLVEILNKTASHPSDLAR